MRRLAQYVLAGLIPAVLIGSLLGQPRPISTIADVIAAAKDGETITLPDGDLVIAQPLKLSGRVGVTIQGGRSTAIIYTGGPTKAIVDFEHTDRCTLRNVAVVCRSSGVEAAVRIGNGAEALPQGPQTTACRIEDVSVPWDGSVVLPDYGLHFDSTSRDANNDLHRVSRFRCTGARKAGIRFYGSQIHRVEIDDSSVINYAGSPSAYGLHAERGVYFVWTGGAMGGWASDFRLGSMETSAVIRDMNSEMSQQLLSGSGSGSPFPVSITGGRFDMRPVAGRPVIDHFGQGPLSVRDAVIISGNDVPPTIRLTCYNAGPSRPMLSTVNVSGCAFYSQGADRMQPSILRPRNALGVTSGNFFHTNLGPGRFVQREAITGVSQ